MRFDKMELMESAIGVQVVLIGQTPSMDYKFVDVSEVFPNQWKFKIFSGTNSVVHILDDIAVTDNYVVFTGREIDADKGYLFCLNRPVSGTVPCQLLVDPLCYSYDVAWPLLIEHCEGDAYATVAMGEEDLLYVSAYDGYSHISTQKTITGYDLTEYCDIKYKKSKKILEILIHRSDYQTYNSLLFHYGTSLISPGVSSVTGHIAYGHWLSSVTNAIASFPGGMGFFLSTGFNGSGDLCIHRYSYLAFPCWGKEEIKVVDVENNEKWGELGLQCEEFTIPYEILPKTSYVHELTSVCGSLE